MIGLITVALFLSFVPSWVLAHGNVTQPQPRKYGEQSLKACGAGAYRSLTQDLTSPIEYAPASAGPGWDPTSCSLDLCRGAQFADNTDNVHVIHPGQEIPFRVNIRIRHTGIANVSIVDLKQRSLIGQPLINWPVYTNQSIPVSENPKNETEFAVVMPDLQDRCNSPGDCAIQWWWYGFNQQTYLACVDFINPTLDQLETPSLPVDSLVERGRAALVFIVFFGVFLLA